MTNEQAAIIELAECVKEIVRVLTGNNTPAIRELRLDKVYAKAGLAKERVTER